MECVASTLVHLTDLSEFPKMNAVYGEYFEKDPPDALELR